MGDDIMDKILYKGNDIKTVGEVGDLLLELGNKLKSQGYFNLVTNNNNDVRVTPKGSISLEIKYEVNDKGKHELELEFEWNENDDDTNSIVVS